MKVMPRGDLPKHFDNFQEMRFLSGRSRRANDESNLKLSACPQENLEVPSSRDLSRPDFS